MAGSKFFTNDEFKTEIELETSKIDQKSFEYGAKQTLPIINYSWDIIWRQKLTIASQNEQHLTDHSSVFVHSGSKNKTLLNVNLRFGLSFAENGAFQPRASSIRKAFTVITGLGYIHRPVNELPPQLILKLVLLCQRRNVCFTWFN